MQMYADGSAAMQVQSEPRFQIPILGCLAMICSSVACAVATANAPIIDEYNEAACVPLADVRRVHPPTREWDTRLPFDRGQIVVKGAQIPGGRISVFDSMSNRDVVAADPGDYIYPSDVRFNEREGVLYIKAHGLAGGFREQTWLFKYDLHRHQIIERRQIKNGILTSECEATAANAKPYAL
jgi:hypothetical protein